jgi:acyl-coenzyme A synthetase/AMP-(fatty) acid ligase
MNLMQETLATLKSRGNEAAIINQHGFKLSFSGFYDETTKFAHLLHERGINSSSKILLLASLDWPLYCTIAACFQLGATVVLVDPWASSDYIQGALSQVEPEFLLISRSARLFYLKKSIRRIPKKILLEDLLGSNTNQRRTEVTDVPDDHTALITFTSGTTGKPKGFDRSHQFLLSQQKAHDTYFDHHPGEVDLSMYPVFVLSNLKSGVTSVLIKGNLRKIDSIQPDEVLRQLQNYQVDSMSVSPVILDKLLTYCEQKAIPFPVNKVFTGGAPVPLTLCKRLLNHQKGIQGHVVYGSTEAEPIALVTMTEVITQHQDLRLGTPLGRVVSALNWKVEKLPAPAHPYHTRFGEVGEVNLTGEFVGKRYWKDEAAFRENKWIDDENRIWHRTGDVVLVQGDFLHMLGRRSNPIRTPEGDLYPVPIENQINQLPGVKKAAYLQQSDKVILAYEGQFSAERLIRQHLGAENLPLDEVVCLDEIPMDARHRSKIDLPKLKDLLLKGSSMITHETPLAKRLLAYTNERFPLIPIMLFVFLLTAGYAHFFASWFGMPFHWSEPKLWITMGTVFMFMLQLRMADEIKDFQKDSLAYPDRILSRGLIKLSLVRAVLYTTITLELLIAASMGRDSLLYMAILQIWAQLMAREFFAKDLLDRKVTLNLVLHQLILPPLAIYSALPFVKVHQVHGDLKILPALVFLTLIYTVYEMARKTWSADRESVHADSYTRFWGINGAVGAQVLLTLVILVLMLSMPIELTPIYKGLAFFFSAFYGLTLFMFRRNPTRKMSKLVETGGSVFVLGMCALNALGLS